MPYLGVELPDGLDVGGALELGCLGALHLRLELLLHCCQLLLELLDFEVGRQHLFLELKDCGLGARILLFQFCDLNARFNDCYHCHYYDCHRERERERERERKRVSHTYTI